MTLCVAVLFTMAAAAHALPALQALLILLAFLAFASAALAGKVLAVHPARMPAWSARARHTAGHAAAATRHRNEFNPRRAGPEPGRRDGILALLPGRHLDD